MFHFHSFEGILKDNWCKPGFCGGGTSFLRSGLNDGWRIRLRLDTGVDTDVVCVRLELMQGLRTGINSYGTSVCECVWAALNNNTLFLFALVFVAVEAPGPSEWGPLDLIYVLFAPCSFETTHSLARSQKNTHTQTHYCPNMQSFPSSKCVCCSPPTAPDD